MKGLIVRTMLIVVAFPLFYVLIFLLPYGNHLTLNLVAVLASFVGSYEIYSMIQKKRGLFSFPLLPILAASISVVAILEVSGILLPGAIAFLIVSLLSLIMLVELFVSAKEGLEHFIDKVSYSLLILLYPSLFITYIIRISRFEESSMLLLFFFSLAFSNDILAYLAGKLFGHQSRMNLAVSPKKSLAGFIAGFSASLVTTVVFYFLVPSLFPVSFYTILIFGSLFGFLVILGDLVESALKRSALIKDSGEIIPGRGGLLDSIDSLLLIAPLFFYFFDKVIKLK